MSHHVEGFSRCCCISRSNFFMINYAIFNTCAYVVHVTSASTFFKTRNVNINNCIKFLKTEQTWGSFIIIVIPPTLSRLGSLSRSIRVIELLWRSANDSAIRPPVLMSFSRKSIRTKRGLSAINSAKATAPVKENNWQSTHWLLGEIGTKNICHKIWSFFLE